MLFFSLLACDRAPAPTSAPERSAAAAPAGTASGIAAGVQYLEVLTGGARPDETLPMVVAIHGLGDRPESFAGVVSAIGAPARVIVPRGLDAYEGGFSWFPFRSGGRDMNELAAGIGGAGSRVAAALAELVKTRPTRGLPIVTGFSQGGMLTYELAVHHPEVVGAAFPLSGMLPPPLWPSSKGAAAYPRIVAFHGDADRVVPIVAARDTVARLAELGFPAELRESAGVGHTVPTDVRRTVGALIEAAMKP